MRQEDYTFEMLGPYRKKKSDREKERRETSNNNKNQNVIQKIMKNYIYSPNTVGDLKLHTVSSCNLWFKDTYISDFMPAVRTHIQMNTATQLLKEA